MSQFDQRYIQNLQNFADTLEELVDFLKTQHEKGGEAGTTDVINKMAENMDDERISQIVEELQEVKDTTKKIDSNTEKILEEVKSAREAKETGMFGKVQSKENKEKITTKQR